LNWIRGQCTITGFYHRISANKSFTIICLFLGWILLYLQVMRKWTGSGPLVRAVITWIGNGENGQWGLVIKWYKQLLALNSIVQIPKFNLHYYRNWEHWINIENTEGRVNGVADYLQRWGV
jgi:hypothetical protein